MKIFRISLVLALLLGAFSAPAHATTVKLTNFQAEVWVDNWFSLYINGKKVGEDSVPITTERSFNSEKIKFAAAYPFTVGFIAKDFTENASGLEYIGKPNQQIGDAGMIFQIRDLQTGEIVAASDTSWKSLIINKAPLNPYCVSSATPLTDCRYKNVAIPSNWATSTFKESTWKSATKFTKEEVGVKDGYFDINWSNSAQLIWSSDLKLDNTVLFRKVIIKGKSSSAVISSTSKNLSLSGIGFADGGKFPITYTCDGAGTSPGFTWSNIPAGTKSLALIMDTIPGPPRPGEADSGIHYYLTLFNLDPSTLSVPASNTSIGTLGLNFKDRTPGYTPPCSQGPGVKSYTATLYALSSALSLSASEATGTALIAAMQGKIIEKKAITFTYERTAG
jgi:phosphatidylethanolamine-binding protein (PEBP) family uncharacterized protein